ncbi:MAG: hypothetical protein WCW02_00645 [Candidatus Buchananbacteria bacterium]
MKKFKLQFLIWLTALTLISPNICLALTFDQNYIISDFDATEYQAMSLVQIQRFLTTQGSSLAYKSFPDFDGNYKTATEIIYNAAQNNKISPRLLLVMLQKEQSLIEDPNPTNRQYQWATGYGVCDGCDITDPRIVLFGGFGNQVELTARIMRKYFEKSEQYNIQSGHTYNLAETFGSSLIYEITPTNQATANLYIYTPYRHGNELFWKIWTRYFKRTYPDGTLLTSKESPADIYLIQAGVKRKFVTKAALVSRFNPKLILTVPASDLDLFEDGSPLKFPQYSVIESTETSNIYLIVGDTKRQIIDNQVFKLLGFNPEEVVIVAEQDLSYYTTSTPLTTKSSYPLGTILQDRKTKALYYAEAGTKSPILNQELLTLRFKNKKIVQVSSTQLDQLFNGETIKLLDGELVKTKNDPAVYVISNGTKRLVPSADLFGKMGYNNKNIIVVSKALLNLHPDGEPITLTTTN